MLGSLRPRQINKQTSIAVTSCSKDGCTALYVASEQGRREIAKLLLQRGADVNITGINGRTTLYIAFEMNNIKVARPFFFGSAANITLTNNDDWTPLILVSFKGNIDGVQLLLGQGAEKMCVAIKAKLH